MEALIPSDLIPAEIVRLHSADGLYELHPSMMGHRFMTRPFTFWRRVRHYKRRPLFLRWFWPDGEVSVERAMVAVVDPDLRNTVGEYPAELVEFLP